MISSCLRVQQMRFDCYLVVTEDDRLDHQDSSQRQWLALKGLLSTKR